jgi:hypothetical protein
MDIAVTQDEAYMFSICQLNEKAKCFSTRPYFTEKIAKGETFRSGGHWEPAGHLAAAEAIIINVIWLMQGTLPCRNDFGEEGASPQSSSGNTRLKTVVR